MYDEFVSGILRVFLKEMWKYIYCTVSVQCNIKKNYNDNEKKNKNKNVISIGKKYLLIPFLWYTFLSFYRIFVKKKKGIIYNYQSPIRSQS